LKLCRAGSFYCYSAQSPPGNVQVCIWASAELQDHLDFPSAAQVFCLQRETMESTTGKFRTETVYGVTRLSPGKADPARLLSLNRHPWSIENGLPCVRDVALDEGRYRLRKHAGAPVMASLRNLALSLLRLAGAVNIAPALRACTRHSQRPWRLLGLVVG
jgi:hypothetical protein